MAFKKSIYILFLLAVLTDSYSQEKTNTGDTYCQLARQMMDENPGEALRYAKKALDLSNSVPEAKTKALYLIGTAYKRLGNLDSSLFYYDVCYNERVKHKAQPRLIAEALNGMGIINSQKSNMELALSLFIRVEKINEETGDSAGIAKALNNIANVYNAISKNDKALEYYQRSQLIKEKLGDEASLNTNRINIASIYIDQNKFDSAEKYLEDALVSAKKLGIKPDLAHVYNQLGFLYFQKGEYKKSIEYHQKSLDLSLELGDEFQVAAELVEIAYACSEMTNYQLSVKYAKEALAYAKKQDATGLILESLEILANNSSMSQDYKNAYYYITEHEKYYDKMINRNSIDKVTELEQKFEVAQKEKKLDELSLDKKNKEIELYRKKTQINYLFIGGILVILALSFIYYRRIVKQKNIALTREKEFNAQKLQATEEKRLLQEKQQTELLNVIINVQEEERKKIAADIHDGLGQLLSGIKMNLQLAMNESLPEKSATLIKNIYELNNESIAESKNIASNLLPYNIKDYGLVTAIKNLCYKSNELTQSKVKFYSNDVPRRIPAELEITIYRITQELINNALKHANADEIFVQLFYRDNKLVLQIEDNGVGYDEKENAAKANSMGLKNIAIRTKLLDGNLQIDSVKGRGTTTMVEFTI